MSKPGKSLKTLCKRLGVRLTVKRGKKRVYKSVAVLKRQCANKKKKKVKRKRRRRKFGASLAGESNEEERDDIRNQVNAALILQALQRESQALLQRERQALQRERQAARRRDYYERNKEQIAARRRDYYERNKEQIAARQKAIYEKHREKIIARQTAWRKNNREKEAARFRDYYERNKEKEAARKKAYNEKHREKMIARQTAWRKNNREKEAARFRDYYERNKEQIAVRQKARYQKNKAKIAAKRKARIAAENNKKRKRKFGRKRKQKLTKKSFFNLIGKIMSVITVGNTFRYLIQDISNTHRRLKQDRTKTQKLINSTITHLNNSNNMNLINQKFQFEEKGTSKKINDYFNEKTVHSGYDSVQDFIDYLENGERRKTEQKSLLGGLTLMAATPIVAFIEMFRTAVTTCSYFRSDDYTISSLIKKLGYKNPMRTNSFGLLPTMEDFEFKEKPFYNEGDLTQLIINLFKKLGIYVSYTIARKVLFAIVLSRFHCLNEHLKSMLERVKKINI